uniref:Uncharacterized protein n=1 Tax=viral metagenome TaxID=1070528 RepID=A0A6M3IYE0_9ZZZZ
MYYNQDCIINTTFQDATDPYYHRDKYCLLNCTQGCKRKTELQDVAKHNAECSKWFFRKV